MERRFGDAVVFRALDLALDRGERLIVKGANGSGKSTLLRCVAGVLRPSAGAVSIEGHAAGTVRARALVGASLAQERSFYLRLTGRENLLFFARLRLPSKKAAAREVRRLEEELVLEEVLPRPMTQCSTGMMQQVGLARALLGDPPLLVLDEPTRSLDTAAVDRFWGALERRPGCAAMVATHRTEDAAHGMRTLDLGG